MRSVLVTGTDTGVGKTRVCGALARLLAGTGARVQIVKLVESGRAPGEPGDAALAQHLADCAGIASITGISFLAPMAPLAAAAQAGETLSLGRLITIYDALPPCDWRIVEGAGGIAVPLDPSGADWATFALQIEVDELIVVVADRLGAINQARLAHAYARGCGLKPRLWLNATAPLAPELAASHRSGLSQASLKPFAWQAFETVLPERPEEVLATLLEPEARSPTAARADDFVTKRATVSLAERDRLGLRRSLRLIECRERVLNLADNDYLDLARDPAVQAAHQAAAKAHGTSASASPLVTGWREPHARLLEDLCAWHGVAHGLLWSSGYAANSAVLGVLPEKDDWVLADRLIHHSMIAGLRRSGARLKRYPHLNLSRLEEELASARDRPTFVVTETVFSMDGDYPDLRAMAALKHKYGFFWVVDEAHALGWYGPGGAGLARACGVETEVDVIVGTLGKTLASSGAYSLFRCEKVRDHLLNHAGEFIYSTSLPPSSVAAAGAALARTRELSIGQAAWHDMSRDFRRRFRSAGWTVLEGESPVVPILIGSARDTVDLAAALRAEGIVVGAVRPPTVPEGTSRLRLSLKRTLTPDDLNRVFEVVTKGRARS